MAKPILNYTTEIPVSKTIGEVQSCLIEAGARSISLEFAADRTPSAITFAIATERGLQEYQLPVRIERVLHMLEEASEEFVRVTPRRGSYGYSTQRRKVPLSKVTPEHAARVGWRVVKDWLEAQVALIQIGLVDLDEVMLPYQLVEGGADGKQQTIYELALSKGLLALPGPN